MKSLEFKLMQDDVIHAICDAKRGFIYEIHERTTETGLEHVAYSEGTTFFECKSDAMQIAEELTELEEKINTRFHTQKTEYVVREFTLIRSNSLGVMHYQPSDVKRMDKAKPGLIKLEADNVAYFKTNQSEHGKIRCLSLVGFYRMFDRDVPCRELNITHLGSILVPRLKPNDQFFERESEPC